MGFTEDLFLHALAIENDEKATSLTDNTESLIQDNPGQSLKDRLSVLSVKLVAIYIYIYIYMYIYHVVVNEALMNWIGIGMREKLTVVYEGILTPLLKSHRT